MQALDPLPGFTFGCDPELFIRDKDGKFISAEGLIPGTKAEPYKVDGGAVQVDGMAAEFNIDPSSSFDEFDNNISKVLSQLHKMLPKGASLVALPAVVFDEDVWEASPEIAKILGCSPDFNAWTGDMNPPPHDPENPRLRTASGHLHIGWTEDAPLSDIDHINNCQDLVKQLDWYLGGWSLRYEDDNRRRRLYGRAGACRIKPYGVEYRVLSNFWVMSRARRREVWNRMQQAIYDMRTNFMPEERESYNTLLIESINTTTVNSSLFTVFSFPLQHLVRL